VEGATGGSADSASGRKEVRSARRLISAAKLQTPIDSPRGSGEWEWVAPSTEGEMLAKGFLYDPIPSYGDPSMNGGRGPDGGAGSSPGWRPEPLRGWIVGGNQWVSAILRPSLAEGATRSGAGSASGRKDVRGARRLISAKLQTPIGSPRKSARWEWIALLMKGEMLARGSLDDPIPSHGDQFMNGE